MTTLSDKHFIMIGSYAEADGPGVYTAQLNEGTGELTLLDQVSGLKNPTFLDVDTKSLRVYAISEAAADDGGKRGEAVCLTVDPANGKLSSYSRAATVSAPTCHIQRDRSGKFLVVSSYHGGLIGLVALNEDGTIGELLDVEQHEGTGPNPERQDQPHPHSALFSPDNRFVFIPDLGLDRIVAYAVDPKNKVLELSGETKLHPGAGPRHMVFHPSGKFAYVINEIDSSLTAFAYESESGQLNPIQTLSTLPMTYEGDNICAEVTVSEDGNYLYGSNRGHDSIVVCKIDNGSGKLSVIEHVSTEGRHPRHFTLTPGGRYLIAANRDTDNVVTYRVDSGSGRLEFTGYTLSVSKPVCVKPCYL
ncbi:lactonase family protein [Paenibacillus sp. FJAT-26967]|uniref:lactonase family protein n=1 Tax=Paenibacillus sp. FJAT-26967 TaxID=1729690 RepID=UPI000837BD77|nr:lactonase family protein [Paenibacillus sp. FJAT-26967]